MWRCFQQKGALKLTCEVRKYACGTLCLCTHYLPHAPAWSAQMSKTESSDLHVEQTFLWILRHSPLARSHWSGGSLMTILFYCSWKRRLMFQFAGYFPLCSCALKSFLTASLFYRSRVTRASYLHGRLHSGHLGYLYHRVWIQHRRPALDSAWRWLTFWHNAFKIILENEMSVEYKMKKDPRITKC